MGKGINNSIAIPAQSVETRLETLSIVFQTIWENNHVAIDATYKDQFVIAPIASIPTVASFFVNVASVTGDTLPTLDFMTYNLIGGIALSSLTFMTLKAFQRAVRRKKVELTEAYNIEVKAYLYENFGVVLKKKLNAKAFSRDVIYYGEMSKNGKESIGAITFSSSQHLDVEIYDTSTTTKKLMCKIFKSRKNPILNTYRERLLAESKELHEISS